MMHILACEKTLYETYEHLPKDHYSFLLCRIKNIHLFQYLYGSCCSDILYPGVLQCIVTACDEHDYIYRLYSDHFILLLHTQDPYKIIQTIYTIDDALISYSFAPITHTIALAFGIYCIRSSKDFYQAYDCAKLAIKYSKDMNKYNTTFDFYDQKGIDHIKKQFIMMSSLEHALQQHEFEIYLQSKVNAQSQCITGAEALIRWVRHGNEVPLREFMPLIDKNAFIRRIDLFVFEEVCKLINKWKAQDIPILSISVNISKSSFEDGFYYVREIKRIQTLYDIDMKHIEFELSENICFENNHRLHRFLDLMKEYGYRCSLDDFGSGYSSFLSLTFLPVHTIKLDSSFCLGEWSTKRDVILTHMLKMLLELDFEIVVEGVETEEIAHFFSKYPTLQLQGYYFSKPKNIENFEAYYRTHLVRNTNTDSSKNI